MFVPKFITTLKGYTREQFFKDLWAGVIVAIIALPLSIALAIASGLSPEKGLYTAIIGGFLISLLGGSRVQIGGPAGAFVVIVYGIVTKFGTDGLIVATILSGFFLALMGLFKFGSLIKFIPTSIVNGFSSGIAVIIASTQIKDFFGLSIEKVPAEFLEKLVSFGEHLGTLQPASLAVGLGTLAVIVLWPRVTKRVPGTLIAVAGATVLALVLHLDVPTIGSQFSTLGSALPAFRFPSLSLGMFNDLLLPSLTLAVLGAVESLLSAVVADGMIGGRHRSNMELVAQGIGNIASGCFGGMPVTGAVARTTANIQNGGRTPVAGMVHSVVLFGIMLAFMPYVKLIPMASLAAVLVMVSYNMGDWEAFRNIRKAPKSDTIVFLATFVLTVFLDVVVAIGVGVVLASLLFMKKMADMTEVSQVSGEDRDKDADFFWRHVKAPEHVSFYEIDGLFFYGAASKFIQTITQRETKEQVLIIKMEGVPFMDATAFDSFDKLLDNCMKRRIKIILLKVQEQPLELMGNFGFLPKFGMENICSTTGEAIARANEVLLEKGVLSKHDQHESLERLKREEAEEPEESGE